MMIFSEFGTLLLLVDKLSQQQVPVIFLTKILNLKFLVLLYQDPVVIINILSDLRHSFEVLVKLLFLLFVIVLVVFLLFRLLSKELFDINEFFIEFFPKLASFSLQDLAKFFLCSVDLYGEAF